MRLWHESLIPYLPRQQLLGQHRECCALRGLGWGRKHATVDYVFNYPIERLVAYHRRVMEEMEKRGWHPGRCWIEASYRGKRRKQASIQLFLIAKAFEARTIYPEHNDAYLAECLDNLKRKGIEIRFPQ